MVGPYPPYGDVKTGICIVTIAKKIELIKFQKCCFLCLFCPTESEHADILYWSLLQDGWVEQVAKKEGLIKETQPPQKIPKLHVHKREYMCNLLER